MSTVRFGWLNWLSKMMIMVVAVWFILFPPPPPFSRMSVCVCVCSVTPPLINLPDDDDEDSFEKTTGFFLSIR